MLGLQPAKAGKSLWRQRLPPLRSFSARPSFQEDAVGQANANKDSKVEILETSNGRGYGLFARQPLAPGELVFRGKALQTSSQRDSHSVQVDWDKHVTMDVPAILVNHSCDANLGIQENDHGAFDFYALRDVPVQSELLWDYETAESQIADFSCSCGAPNCRGELEGFESHGNQVLKTYGKHYIAPYLLRNKN